MLECAVECVSFCESQMLRFDEALSEALNVRCWYGRLLLLRTTTKNGSTDSDEQLQIIRCKQLDTSRLYG